MRFEISERITTKSAKADILRILEEQFRKVADTVERSGEKIIVKSIEASFGSINRKDTTTVEIRINNEGYLFVADVNYRPSGCFWAIILITLFTTVGWLIPIIFYFYQRKTVQESIKDVFSRVKDEFQTASSSTISQASSIDQIEKLASLKERGFITEAEFMAKKKVLLGL